jgi:hypothetical protein
MASVINPSLNIFKTLISANAGEGCPNVEVDNTANYYTSNELMQLQVRVRIYEKRKIMYAKTGPASTELKNLADLVSDTAARDMNFTSNVSTLEDQKNAVEEKVDKFLEEFKKQYKILEDEDWYAKDTGTSVDLRDAQGLAPAASSSPFKTSDMDLTSALALYELALPGAAYDKVKKFKEHIQKFDEQLALYVRISPNDVESTLAKYNFNIWETLRLPDPGLSDLINAVVARELLIQQYKNAWNLYMPQNPTDVDAKMDTYVNPNKLPMDAQGSTGQFPIGVSGEQIIHNTEDVDLNNKVSGLKSLTAAAALLLGGRNIAVKEYKDEFGNEQVVVAQIATLLSAAEVNQAKLDRRKLVSKLSTLRAAAATPTTESMTDQDLETEITRLELIFAAYYKAYGGSVDITFQQVSDVLKVEALTKEREGLNSRAVDVFSAFLLTNLKNDVGDDNKAYEKKIKFREDAVEQLKEFGGQHENPNWKSLDAGSLKAAIAQRKLIIDKVASLYKGTNNVVTLEDIKKLDNAQATLESDARLNLMQEISKRALDPNNDANTKTDSELNDLIGANDAKYDNAIQEISKYSGIPESGNASTNNPTMLKLESKLSKLKEKRTILMASATSISAAADPNLTISGVKLSVIIDKLSTLSNGEIEKKLEEIEKVSKNQSVKTTFIEALKNHKANIGLSSGIISAIDVSDTKKAEELVLVQKNSLDQTGQDIDTIEVDIKQEPSLDSTAKSELETDLKEVKTYLETARIKLNMKVQNIQQAKNNTVQSQASAARIKTYQSVVDNQNLQASDLVDKFNVTYETETSFAIQMLEKKEESELARLATLSPEAVASVSNFTSKLDELRKGATDWAAGEEISMAIQRLSNFDDVDNGDILGDSSKSQRAQFSSEVDISNQRVKLLKVDNPDAPFESLDLGWDEKDDEDTLFISSWARLVPNLPEGKKGLERLGLEWLTETLYVDMLDRKNVFNYNGFLNHYRELLKSRTNKDFAKRASYTDSVGKPVTMRVELPGNTNLGGSIGIPLDMVTVGVAQGEDIDFLAGPSIEGLIPYLRNTLIDPDKKEPARIYPNMEERRDINNILKTFFITDSDGKSVKAYPAAGDWLNVEDEDQFGKEAWKSALDNDAALPEDQKVHLKKGTAARNAYDLNLLELASTEAAYAFIQRELLDVAKIKLRFHRIQPYKPMTQGAAEIKGKAYLGVQCSGLNNYCVLFKDGRSRKFDFLAPELKVYIFNMDGEDLKKYNKAIKISAAATTASGVGAPVSLLDTDDEDVSNFRFIPNI